MFKPRIPAMSYINLLKAWGDPWDNESIQHVFVGIISFTGALLGAALSRYRKGRFKRNILPGIVRFHSSR
jgi:hypothetical protein